MTIGWHGEIESPRKEATVSEADEQMPLEIWTDINGNATRTQFKGGVKYIRADERDRLKRALEEIAMGTIAWERDEMIDCALAALTPAGGGQDGQHGRR